ncbi:hypothetical protein CK203_117067 [Vitis vinifera]|uniref:Uncharacterized protein n=1 Tax=Vitis vinifera TaxID=29760 RepID=A0A438CQT9_VITVI|nr:hypothetical protein CK203_117067 [Vitis vinifera]
MPTTLSPPFPAAQEITPDSSSCNRLIMSITQIEKPPASPPPPHIHHLGPFQVEDLLLLQSASVAGSLASVAVHSLLLLVHSPLLLFTPMTTSNSPCYGKKTETISKRPSVPPPTIIKYSCSSISKVPTQYDLSFILIVQSSDN